MKVGDNITTDHIMPAGNQVLPLRSNIEAISAFVFFHLAPGFSAEARQKGALVVIGGDNYGQGSGPRLGLGELILPPVQPGSSTMPGKVNPVIAEALIMVCAQVIGNDSAITIGGLYANFQLNTMLPLIAGNLLQQISLLSGGCTIFTNKLLLGLVAEGARIEAANERSLALVTGLVPAIGYDRAAEIAKAAHASGRTIREVARELKVLPEAELDRLLDPSRQTG